MAVFEYKDGFRPRDQSVSTKLKYETEAQLWADALFRHSCKICVSLKFGIELFIA